MYRNKEFSFAILFIILAPITCLKQYRTDYIYNRKTDAFYKFHIEKEWFHRASIICKNEGASLILPTSEYDVSQVHGMFKQYPDLGNEVWVDKDGEKHESVEESTLINLEDSTENRLFSITKVCNILTRDGDIKSYLCMREFPFVCKVSAKDAVFDTRCKVYGKDYQYFENGSCYKVPKLIFSWNQAYDECRAEGAHLAVLNSELEHEIVQNLTNAAPFMFKAKTTWFFYVGIRAEKKTDGSPIVFKTIFNQTLESAGYNSWSEHEPNNYMGNEYCGTIFKNDGKYNDVDCSHLYGFVCEKEVTNF